jgi:hypothetical protein
MCATYLEGNSFWLYEILHLRSDLLYKQSSGATKDTIRLYVSKMANKFRDLLCCRSRPIAFLRRVRVKCEKRLLSSLCFPSVSMDQLCSKLNDFHEIWYWGLVWKSVERPNLVKIAQRCRALSMTTEFYVCIVDSSAKYFVARRRCRISMATL